MSTKIKVTFKPSQKNLDWYGIYYTYDVQGNIISFNYDEQVSSLGDGEEYFYLRSLQGDVYAILDSTGQVVVKYVYDAYGNILDETEVATGYQFLFAANPYTYRGYRFDRETGLYYLQSRYYDSEMGRFVNQDGLLKASNTIFAHNLFLYTENNPVNYADTCGYCYAYVDDDGNVHEDAIGCASGGGIGTPMTGGALSGGGSRFSGTLSYNDIYPTGINSGIGNMIDKYGPTENWMNGTYSFGLSGFMDTFTGVIPRNVIFDNAQLQHNYDRHNGVELFGVKNKGTIKAYQLYIYEFIQTAPSSKTGYYFNISGTHYYNSSTQEWAFVTSNGNFHTYFYLSEVQIYYLLNTGTVR